ncbi:MAG: hypothetical protein IPK87_13935 [Planctomycetes bacterium]|nr:hypothetical protein [Planctomycetota bacterium]
MFKDLRPSTVIVLVVLCALIFVPAFFLDVGTMGKGGDGNGEIETPPLPPPSNRPGLPPIDRSNRAPANQPKVNGSVPTD